MKLQLEHLLIRNPTPTRTTSLALRYPATVVWKTNHGIPGGAKSRLREAPVSRLWTYDGHLVPYPGLVEVLPTFHPRSRL